MTKKKHHQRRRLRRQIRWEWLFKAIIYLGQLAAFFYRLYDRE